MISRSKFRFVAQSLMASVVIGLASFEVLAYSFVPEPAEFMRWSKKCQGLYLGTDIGERSDFVGFLPQEYVKQVRLDDRTGAWHFCAGQIFLQRAKRKKHNPVEYERLLRYAQGEMTFSTKKVEVTDPWYPQMLTALGTVYDAQEEHGKAMRTYERVIKTHPHYAPVYSAYSISRKNAEGYANAIEILKRTPEDVLASSAELNYLLGLYHFKSGDIATAKRYSAVAYDLGYPLPWLKEQLKKL